MSTTKASEREKQLETDLQAASNLRDEYKAKLDTVTGERDEAVAQRDQATTERDQVQEMYETALNAAPLFDDPYAALDEEQFDTVLEIVLGEARNRGIATTEDEAEPTKEATTTQEPTEADTIRDILKRNGLKKCWMLAGSPCFSEAHAREYAGAEFDSLTVISVEENAGLN